MTKFKEVQHYQALIDDLIARGKEKGFLTHEEVLHALPGDHGPEQYEEILSTLEERKILVVDNEKDAMKKLSRPSMDEDSEKDSLDISDDDDAADYSSRSTDPVRMYLREMGAVPLLDRDGEVVIAKKIEQGEMDVLYALVEVPVAVEELINVGDELRQSRIKLKDVVKTIEEDDPSEDEMNQRSRVLLLLDEIREIYRKKRKLYKKLNDSEVADYDNSLNSVLLDSAKAKNNFRIVFTSDDSTEEPEEEETPTEEPEKDPLVWLYVVSGVVSGAIVIIIVIILIKKFAPKRKKKLVKSGKKPVVAPKKGDKRDQFGK